MSREEVFDKLETIVFDEEGIVTYKLLSREFKIHVNEAKKHLQDFLTAHKAKKNLNLQVTYFLTGFQEKDDNRCFKMCIVSEEGVESAKKDLNEVSGCHIYSISKVKTNGVVLYKADLPHNRRSQESKGLLVIKHPNIEIKPPTLSKVTISKNPAKPFLKPQNTEVSKKATFSKIQTNGKGLFPQKTSNDVNSKNKEEMIEKKADKTNVTSEVKKPSSEVQKPNSLTSLWQKSEDKSKSTKTEPTKSDGKGKTKSPQESKKPLPKNNIMNMFSKQNEKNAANSIKKVSDPVPVKKVEVASSSKQVENITDAKSDKKLSKTSAKKRKPSQKQAKSSRKQSIGSDSDECKPAKKKHKRIAVFDDSDSSSDAEDMEAEDEAQKSVLLPEDPIEAGSQIVPPTPETDEDPIPPTPPVIPTKGRRKISKTVKKTFMDEEGFMVTTEEKEMVSESGSDEDPMPTKSVKKETKETAKSNNFSYRKQASLTNFFKRS